MQQRPLQSLPREDSYLHKGQRKKLVDALREKGITDEKALNAIHHIPRHFFLDPALERYAYQDRAFPIAAGQTISQPYTVAFQTQLLNIKPLDKVLEVGTGSAYQACVLAEMGAMVYSIERQQELFRYNNDFFFLNKYLGRLKRFYGDGFEGLPSFAPFDKVIITAAAPSIPRKLMDQLKPGGIMIVPVNTEDGGTQTMTRLTRSGNGYEQEVFGNFSFVPMLEGRQNK